MTADALWLQLESAEAGHAVALSEALDAIAWNDTGLIPVITQRHDSGEVLMLAWMNCTALQETLHSGQVCYWSRSRQQLWRKGETSGHRQRLLSAHLDCDGDALLIKVEQLGPACHTGRSNCFYNDLDGDQLRVAVSRPA
ncbi:phosphoribosyl-AMP cyclohydrolase [Pseudomonas sp. 8O]|uniref:phosphoribosyl-AMP cyclohydrolase n=1 Tax=Pseudomonas sp. 8O TaxID=2653165 RepID=UPI0012F3F902|nr:phosphoribosyl-AMP cyclohydrolase [Pseudomonas sp. 8O]VXA91471.1 Phosphoribosyl-AMP cyclohydrolase 2 [Pseudomonas sp. 8O]